MTEEQKKRLKELWDRYIVLQLPISAAEVNELLALLDIESASSEMESTEVLASE